MDSRERFTDRVDDYVRYRPSYPRALVDLLAHDHGLGPQSVVVDLGSGTGIFTRLLLGTGARVVAVEPNEAMRAAAERDLAGEPRFTSVAGTAEAIPLAGACADFVTAAQAFHWFEPVRARAETARVLRPGGAAAVVWNLRASTAFNDDYEALLDCFAPDYPAVRARDRAAEGKLGLFFAPSVPRAARFRHAQRFDEAGLRGRLLSSSYAPKRGHPMHEPMMRRLSEVFAAHAQGGFVEMTYDAVCWDAPIA